MGNHELQSKSSGNFGKKTSSKTFKIQNKFGQENDIFQNLALTALLANIKMVVVVSNTPNNFQSIRIDACPLKKPNVKSDDKFKSMYFPFKTVPLSELLGYLSSQTTGRSSKNFDDDYYHPELSKGITTHKQKRHSETSHEASIVLDDNNKEYVIFTDKIPSNNSGKTKYKEQLTLSHKIKSEYSETYLVPNQSGIPFIFATELSLIEIRELGTYLMKGSNQVNAIDIGSYAEQKGQNRKAIKNFIYEVVRLYGQQSSKNNSHVINAYSLADGEFDKFSISSNLIRAIKQ